MIAFVHIPKTAGGTLRSIVREWYGDEMSWIALDEGANEPITGSTRVVYGHSAHVALHRAQISRAIAFVREPIERLQSHYTYWQSVPTSQASPPLHRHVLEGASFMEFVTDPTMINLQSRYISPFREIDLYAAGHLFDRELARLAASLHREVPEFENANVTRGVKPDVSIEQMRWINRLNADDLDLWTGCVRSDRQGRAL